VVIMHGLDEKHPLSLFLFFWHKLKIQLQKNPKLSTPLVIECSVNNRISTPNSCPRLTHYKQIEAKYRNCKMVLVSDVKSTVYIE
jgi:hypothetical protein